MCSMFCAYLLIQVGLQNYGAMSGFLTYCCGSRGHISILASLPLGCLVQQRTEFIVCAQRLDVDSIC
jgi:hypothetical protein